MKSDSLAQEITDRESFDMRRPLPADQLLKEQGYVLIAFKGQIYTLRQTRNDKLILTK
ncbi:MAG: hemin uptake protein HemP [Hydrogenophilaceae bacterium]|nr:hemin uptake protein HemP [Hydrogenophilaceae bacterium]